MSQDDREAYQVQAEHEDLNKRSLLEQALPAGSKPLMEAKEDGVRHHTRQKISHKRLLKNFDAARNSPIWQLPQQLGDRHLMKFWKDTNSNSK